jgi:hypothetical protein
MCPSSEARICRERIKQKEQAKTTLVPWETMSDILLSTFRLCQTQFKCKAEVFIHLTSILFLDPIEVEKLNPTTTPPPMKAERLVVGEKLADPEATAGPDDPADRDDVDDTISGTLSAVSSFLLEGVRVTTFS